MIDRGWQRYLLGSLHEELPYPEVPIKVYYRSRSKGEDEAPDEPDTSEVVFTGDEPLDVELPE